MLRLCNGAVGKEGVQRFLLLQVQLALLFLQRQLLPDSVPRIAFIVHDVTPPAVIVQEGSIPQSKEENNS